MQFMLAATIAILIALVGGAAVWVLWSVGENLAAARRAKREQASDSGDAPERGQ